MKIEICSTVVGFRVVYELILPAAFNLNVKGVIVSTLLMRQSDAVHIRGIEGIVKSYSTTPTLESKLLHGRPALHQNKEKSNAPESQNRNRE